MISMEEQSRVYQAFSATHSVPLRGFNVNFMSPWTDATTNSTCYTT